MQLLQVFSGWRSAAKQQKCRLVWEERSFACSGWRETSSLRWSASDRSNLPVGIACHSDTL